MLLASLPMYDLPELRPETRAWWEALARALRKEGLVEVPDRLTVPEDLERHWLAEGLLFTQTCGYPLTHALAGKVRYLATPCYRAQGCRDGHYSSMIVVRRDDPVTEPTGLRGYRAVINGVDSQSGRNALRQVIASEANGDRFFSSVIRSGGHARSLELVVAGDADVAAIDCVTFALLSRVRPQAVEPLRVLLQSAAVPALPYVTALSRSDDEVARMRAGLVSAMMDPSLEALRAALLLDGIEILPEAAYDMILEMERRADRLGAPALSG